MAELSPRGERLRRELLYLRDQAGLSGRKLAALLGTNQGKIWRIDNGHQLPPIPMVRSWLDACGVEEPKRQQVLDLAEAVHGETRPWGDLLAGVGHLQGVAQQRETEAGVVRNFQPTIIPGLLQTPEYAARVIPLADHMGTIDHDAALAARLQRQQVLYEEGHRFQFLLVETALRWSIAMGDIGPAQLDRIASLSRLATVEVGIIPSGQDVVVPWHNFVILEPADDDPYVVTELFHGEQRITTSEQVELYRSLWERMWKAAAHGDEARALIREASDG
jgi:transcriptional regulator with XRE-family HTH domain